MERLILPTGAEILLFIAPIAVHVLFHRWIQTTQIHDEQQLQVLQDGLVYIPKMLSPALQQQLVREILHHGHSNRNFWTDQNQLNNHRQGRGRIYDNIKSYSSSRLLQHVCACVAERSRAADPTLPHLNPTHLLTLFYTTNRKLGWHSDNGPQDGQSLQPVVSVSLGDSCRFALRLDDGTTRRLELQSGDVVVFGGPSRWIWHSVEQVYLETAPMSLRHIHQTLAPSFWESPSQSFRINLTFRHAPELLGQESTDRFIYFAKSARTFIEKTRKSSVDTARHEVVANRRARKEAKQRRRAQLRADEERTGKPWWAGKK